MIRIVVWQFWGRAAVASWTLKARTLLFCAAFAALSRFGPAPLLRPLSLNCI